MTMGKCVFVTGKEGTGGALIARTIAHALSLKDFNSWDGNVPHIAKNEWHKVQHTSLPYGGKPGSWPDIDSWVRKNRAYDQFFVVTTRDVSISERSKILRCGKTQDQVRLETSRARRILSRILKGEYRLYIFSYESFMYLGQDYLRKLYEFLRIDSNFMPALRDANPKYLQLE